MSPQNFVQGPAFDLHACMALAGSCSSRFFNPPRQMKSLRIFRPYHIIDTFVEWSQTNTLATANVILLAYILNVPQRESFLCDVTTGPMA